MIPDPIQSQYILDRHSRKVKLCNTTHVRLREASNKVLESFTADATTNNIYAALKTAEPQNEIEEANLAMQQHLLIIITVDEKYKHDAEWKIYRDRKGDL